MVLVAAAVEHGALDPGGLGTLGDGGADLRGLKPMEQANAAGKLLASRAKDAGVDSAVFDRGGYQYHGRVKALAEGAREGGLNF